MFPAQRMIHEVHLSILLSYVLQHIDGVLFVHDGAVYCHEVPVVDATKHRTFVVGVDRDFVKGFVCSPVCSAASISRRLMSTYD